jgi:protein O-mannosyl-transferase
VKGISEQLNRFFSHRNFNIIAFGIIAGLILIAYSNTFYASFHFDDNPSIVDNYYVKSGDIRWALSTNRPLVDLSLMLNYRLNGMNVLGYHIFNIGCHVMNSFMVYLLILWTIKLPVVSARYSGQAQRMALFGAVLFAVHPVQTESVTYIISRSELVTSFFYLLTMLLFIKGALKNKFAYFVAAAFASLCAMQSKEWAVTLPATMLLYDYLFLSEGRIKPVLSRGLPYVLIALPWAVVLYKVPLFGGVPGASYGFGIDESTARGVTKLTYPLTSLNVLWTYLRLMFLPINQNLDYEYPIAKTLFEFPTLLSFAGHVAVVAASFWLYWKKKWLLVPFGLAWFYITLSPVQSVVPIVDVIFEHRIYLPSIGVILAFVAAYEQMFDWIAKKSAARKGVAARA